MTRVYLFVFAVLSGLVFCVGAEAAIAKDLTYNESNVWRCAVRFIRVDSGYKIIEKDKEAGYLLFEFRDGANIHNGSVEVLQVTKNQRKYVRVQMNIFGQPKYIETMLFKKLERKLRAEYGFAPEAEYVSPPVDLTGGAKNAGKESKGEVDEDASEEDLVIDDEDLDEIQEE